MNSVPKNICTVRRTLHCLSIDGEKHQNKMNSSFLYVCIDENNKYCTDKYLCCLDDENIREKKNEHKTKMMTKKMKKEQESVI